MGKRVSITFFALLNALCLYAQNNYNTQAYSAYSALTGGACITCSSDNSIFIYNPGAIGFLDSASFSINATLYGVDHVKLSNGAGPGINLISNRLSANAQAMAGNIVFKRAPGLRLIYGYLLRNFTRFDFEQQNDFSGDIIPQLAGAEFYHSKFDMNYQFAEYWGGGAIGYRINKNVAIGLGHYAGYVGMRGQSFQNTRIDGVTPTGVPYSGSADLNLKYNVDEVFLLFKPGIDLHFGQFKIGLAATLPSIRFWGQGRIYQSIQTANLNVYATDTGKAANRYTNYAAIGDERKVKTNYKVAPSISLGFEYTGSNFRIAVYGEYFFAIKQYEIINASNNFYSYPTETGNNAPIQNFMRISNSAIQVINTGFGLDQRISRNISILSGFRTDFNNKVPLLKRDYSSYVSVANPEYWNYLHYSFGLAIKRLGGTTFIGLTYKQGFSRYKGAFTNLSNPDANNLFSGIPQNNMTTNAHGIGIVVGYTNFSGKGNGLPFRLRGAKEKKKKNDGR